MKALQNNFTTPEQSKRLLELGVPADSADMIYICWNDMSPMRDLPYLLIPDSKFPTDTETIPSWSVGRLIEIYHICDKPGCSFSFHVCFPNLISEMIYKIAEAKERGWIDFSKLED